MDFDDVHPQKGHHYDVWHLTIRYDLARGIFRAFGEDRLTWDRHRLFFGGDV